MCRNDEMVLENGVIVFGSDEMVLGNWVMVCESEGIRIVKGGEWCREVRK